MPPSYCHAIGRANGLLWGGGVETEASRLSPRTSLKDACPSVANEWKRMRKQLEQDNPHGTRPIGFQIAPADDA